MQGIKNLTQGPINRQLFNLAMPIMATSFIQMAYSLTDMAWVGRLGSEAVAAVGSVGILTWMSGSISLLNKVGSEVSVGQSIGAQNYEDARCFASHNITIALVISLCWGGLLFLFARPIIGIYELEAHITENAIAYLRIISTGLPFIFLSAAFTGIYNAEEAKSHSISVAPDYYLILSSIHFSFSVSDWVPTERPMLPGFHRQQYSAFSSTNYVAEMLCWNGSRFSRG